MEVPGMSCRNSAFAIILIASILPLSAAAELTENSCIECHKDSSFFAQYPKLHEYFQQWLASPHRQAGITCDACHGGNAAAAAMGKAHKGLFPMSDPRSLLHYQNQPETCGQCHRDKKRQFVRSKHFAALMDQRAAPTCTTCHPAMSQRPELRMIVLNACRNCHGEGNSEDLPLITARAEHMFSQLNIVSGLLGWAHIHYESHGWPGNSEQRVASLDKRYNSIVNRVHRFDLQYTEDETASILGELRDIFDEERNAQGKRPETQ
jgi:hypothetical protein